MPRTETAPETYIERVGRYRVMRHDELPEGHKAAYRADGIDPDTIWRLVYSFYDEAAARDCLADCIASAARWETFKLVDGGEAVEIERSIW